MQGGYTQCYEAGTAKTPKPRRAAGASSSPAPRAAYLGTVEAPDANTAVEIGAKEFGYPAWRLIAEGDRVKRETIRGVKIVRGPYKPAELPFTLHYFDAVDNLIETLRRYPDLASGRQAFDAAVRHRRQRRLCLRHGAQVLAKHEPRCRKGEDMH